MILYLAYPLFTFNYAGYIRAIPTGYRIANFRKYNYKNQVQNNKNNSKTLTTDLKSWPHSDMQCASSTANKEIPTFSNFDQKL